MCGRFAQYNGVADYLEQLQPDKSILSGYDNLPIDRYNVAPRTKVTIFREVEKGILIEPVTWGWKPEWAKDMQPVINARTDKLMSSKFYYPVRKHRCLIPANGWFEWVQEGSIKQPYFLHQKSDAPIFFAGIGQFSENDNQTDGFMIITTEAQGKLNEIHERQPVILSPEFARHWLDNSITLEEADQILLDNSFNPEKISWYKVNKAVGSVKNQGKYLIEAI